MTKFRRIAFASASASVLLLCSACGFQTPTQFAQRRVEIVPGYYDKVIQASEFDAEKARQIAGQYKQSGNGTMEIAVTYDPHSRRMTARMANDEAARIGMMLQERGVRDFKAEILPVADTGQGMQVQIRYASQTARAPSGCDDAFAIDDINAEAYRSYELGCTTETYVAKQIDRPADLLGKGGTQPGSGRRAANIIETYQTGTPNPQMDGIQASGN
jgi:type IV pilus biogenesis protein CpaD/CtpE